jgi:hypothetical protein
MKMGSQLLISVASWMAGLVLIVAAAAYVAAVRRPSVPRGNRKANVRVGKMFEAYYYEETKKSTPPRKREAKSVVNASPGK